jgi:hypothetical protein
MTTMTRILNSTPARIVLRGHGSVPAELEVVKYPRARWALRTLGYLLLWFVIGGALAYRSWTGRYQIRAFRGHCPRCENALTIKPGSKIDLPHPLVCYNCHHEPELVV